MNCTVAVNVQSSACDRWERSEAIIAHTKHQKLVSKGATKDRKCFIADSICVLHPVIFILTNDVPHCNNDEPLDKEKYLFAYHAH